MRVHLTLACSFLLPFLIGCGDGTTVSGAVTYEGRDLDKGFITFFPVQDSGPTIGAEVVAGRYQVANLTPGKKRVHIAAEPRVAEALKSGSRLKLLPSVPSNAVGNDQVVIIAEGSQTLDFRLEKPKGR